MTENVVTKWFLWPLDAQGNEVVPTAFGGLHGAVIDFKLMECDDGVKRHLYEVPSYQIANRFLRSQKQTPSEYKILTSLNEGKPKIWVKVAENKINRSKIKRGCNKVRLGAMMSKHRK